MQWVFVMFVLRWFEEVPLDQASEAGFFAGYRFPDGAFQA